VAKIKTSADAIRALREVVRTLEDIIDAFGLRREWSRMGGKRGGKLRWQGVSKAERSAIARKAAEARWGAKRAKS